LVPFGCKSHTVTFNQQLMARLDPVDSDDESAKVNTPIKSKSSAKASSSPAKDAMEVDKEERQSESVPEGSQQEEEEEEEEEEYEIEAILGARKGAFPQVRSLASRVLLVRSYLASRRVHFPLSELQGRTGYLVKWKGYDETENSWVDERDAG
jgi:hypothetical protein